jgi:hypothetical protein
VTADFWFDALKKTLKKSEKKLASPWRLLLNGDSTRQIGPESRSKKFEKSEKKTCQRRRNLISLPKPNQTNGETND